MVDSEKLPLSFYEKDSVTELARELIGKSLWSLSDGKLTGGYIVETEAYSYVEKACHAHLNRRTKRTETLYARGGTAYIYLCYGIHHLFNVVTNREGTAEAVLIRAIDPHTGIEVMQSRRGEKISRRQLTSGPGKLSAALNITTKRNGISLAGDRIWIGTGKSVGLNEVITDVRIGVDYAGEDALLPWRFLLKDNPYLSAGPMTERKNLTLNSIDLS